MIIEYEPNLDIIFIHTDKRTDRSPAIESVFRTLSQMTKKKVIHIPEGKPNPFNPTVMSKFLGYLKYHEEDISIGEDDFDDLREMFENMFGRAAKYEKGY